MKPVKFGVVGAGIMGHGHCKNLAAVDEAEVVAIADTNPATLAQVAGEMNARPFESYAAMIRDGGIDAVLIATPHYFHPPIAEFAARHGVHVLSEKPLAVSVGAADGMVEACRAAGVLLGVMFQQRTEASRRTMKRMIDDGVIGPLHRIAMTVPWYRPQQYYDSGAWRGTWKGEGGGVLMNQAPHSVDQFLWLGGPPLVVQGIASTRLHQIEVENTCTSLCEYAEGQVGWFYASTAEIPGQERIEVAGDKGALLWENGKLRHYALDEPLSQHLRSAPEPFGQVGGAWHDVVVEPVAEGHVEVVKAFARAVQENDETLMVANGEAGQQALELANAMLLAGFTRRPVSLPLDRAAFEQMLEKLQNGVSPAELREG